MGRLIADKSVHGLVVAKAGLNRLLKLGQDQKLKDDVGAFDVITLPLSEVPGAAAQGALAIEVLSLIHI